MVPLWTLAALLGLTSAAKILHVPTNINSHIRSQGRLACGLAEQGQQPSILIASNAKVPPFIHDCEVEVIIYKVNDTIPFMNTREASDYFFRMAQVSSIFEKVSTMMEFGKQLSKHFDQHLSEMFESEAVNHCLEEGFDVAIIDNTGVMREILLPFSKDIPVIVFGLQVLPYAFREPVLASFVPHPLFTEYTEDMTFPQRLINTVASNMIYILPKMKANNFEEFLPIGKTELDPWSVISQAVKFYFYLSDIGISYPKPLMPNSAYLGDIMYRDGEPLPSELEEIVTDSPNGVIIVSFGSYFSHFPQSLAETLCEVFEQIPQRVIWKSDSKYSCDLDNVMIMDWIPQNDLLAHPNVRLFISHCGMNSVMEAIYHATPILGVPLGVDQLSNAAMLEHKGLGLKTTMSSLTISGLVMKITNIVTNETFSNNAKHVSAIMRNQKESAAERASFWVDHVIKYGDFHLKTSAFKLNWFQFYMIDVLLTILLFIILVILFLVSIIYLCIRCCVRRLRTKHKTE